MFSGFIAFLEEDEGEEWTGKLPSLQYMYFATCPLWKTTALFTRHFRFTLIVVFAVRRMSFITESTLCFVFTFSRKW